jgi:hypothetical protein
MTQVTDHPDMPMFKARIQQFLRRQNGLDLSVLQIWEAAPWFRQGEESGPLRWDWVSVSLLERVLRQMSKDGHWQLREVADSPRYRFEASPEDSVSR